ncbi:MAG: pyridoxal 5'-phosphate synthase glutaminase subunit PdxT [Dehalococcoidia bacterium]
MINRIGVLALQGDFAEHIAVLRSLGADAVEVRLPEQLAGLDGLIIPGGESTTIARLMHRWELLAPVRAMAREGKPVWGTCAGAILLAERTDDLDREGLRLMDITVERNAFGRQVDSFEANLDVPALGREPYRGVFIRAPRITEVGAKAETLARLDDGTAVAAKQGHLLATAFHPELTDDTRFHEYFLALAHEQRAPAAKAAAER